MLLALLHVLATSPPAIIQPSLLKIRPGTSLGPALKHISAAKNEYESFQLVVSAPGNDSLTVTSIEVSFGEGSLKALIHRELYINITTVSDCDGDLGLWPDALVPVVDPFFHEARTALPAKLAAGARAVFWVDVFIPPTASAGTSTATVTVSFDEDGVAPLALPLDVHVWDFALPSNSARYVTTYGVSMNRILLGQYLTHQPKNVTDAERTALMREYVLLGLMHRVTLNPFLETAIHLLGKTSADGTVAPDWTAVEKDWGDLLHGGVATPFGLADVSVSTVQLPPAHFGERGPAGRAVVNHTWHATGCTAPTPEWGYAYWGMQPDLGAADMMIYCHHSEKGEKDPWAKTCGPVGGNGTCILQHPPLPPLNNTRAIAYWRSAEAHAKAAGWLHKVFDYTCDEPGAKPERIAACKLHGDALHTAGGLRSLITAERPAADSANLTDLIDVWVPIINFMDSSKDVCPHYPAWAYGDNRHEYDDLVAAGKDLWFYQSCMSEGCASGEQPAPGSHKPGCVPSETCYNGTWPSYMIDAPATFNRAMSWMAYLYDIRGELYWGTNAADGVYTQSDTNSSFEHQWLAGGNGDGSLTYPGRPSVIGGKSFIPLASVRLKLIRDGLEDLELMYIAEAKLGRAAVLEVVKTVVHSAYDFEHGPAAWVAARQELARRLTLSAAPNQQQ
jgi:hypothetical protein